MAEYWKSQAKKFCEICKVWFADNKASIDNHEMGQKHKAMVQQRLREMGQKSKQKDKDTANLNATLVAMEAAALAAMKRDGQSIPSNMAPPTVGLPTTSAPPVPSGSTKRKAEKVDPKEELKERKKKWKELKKSSKTSEFWNRDQEDEVIEWVQAEAEGGFYYWNIFSGETVWEVPSVFYTTEEYSQNYEKVQQQIEDEKNRLKEEAEKKKKEAENEEAMKAYNEQYQQYCQQWYQYQQQLQTNQPPPPPPAEGSVTVTSGEIGTGTNAVYSTGTGGPYNTVKSGNSGTVTPSEGINKAISMRIARNMNTMKSDVLEEFRDGTDGVEHDKVDKEGSNEATESGLDEIKIHNKSELKPECTVYQPLTEEEKEPSKRSAAGLGKWTTIVKEPEVPKTLELEQQDKVVYDDLPEQQIKTQLDFDVDEDPSETKFSEKVLPVKSTKKSSKEVVFKKRTASNRNQRRTTGADL
ncbi:unnamed protein product [Bursaphelenchus okinawaensis]|uniref:Matrin-type domain-containing protein n=1 Tax=Bursaphelenchus okinawaensis TaxID=465554 RepID=A0A811LNE7_9BILA|nr:unnamed protein product [Bursaphelenchus okinawaensis]CAG9127262.1 unnamed protein product [Bursaphelenchus okinawaensis]